MTEIRTKITVDEIQRGDLIEVRIDGLTPNTGITHDPMIIRDVDIVNGDTRLFFEEKACYSFIGHSPTRSKYTKITKLPTEHRSVILLDKIKLEEYEDESVQVEKGTLAMYDARDETWSYFDHDMVQCVILPSYVLEFRLAEIVEAK